MSAKAPVASKAKKLIISGVVIIFIFLVSWRAVVIRGRFQEKISEIHKGMTSKEVMQVMGEPRQSKKPCYAPRPTCNLDLVYTAPFDFVNSWTISLDQSGHIIDIFHWHSQ